MDISIKKTRIEEIQVFEKSSTPRSKVDEKCHLVAALYFGALAGAGTGLTLGSGFTLATGGVGFAAVVIGVIGGALIGGTLGVISYLFFSKVVNVHNNLPDREEKPLGNLDKNEIEVIQAQSDELNQPEAESKINQKVEEILQNVENSDEVGNTHDNLPARKENSLIKVEFAGQDQVGGIAGNPLGNLDKNEISDELEQPDAVPMTNQQGEEIPQVNKDEENVKNSLGRVEIDDRDEDKLEIDDFEIIPFVPQAEIPYVINPYEWVEDSNNEILKGIKKYLSSKAEKLPNPAESDEVKGLGPQQFSRDLDGMEYQIVNGKYSYQLVKGKVDIEDKEEFVRYEDKEEFVRYMKVTFGKNCFLNLAVIANQTFTVDLTNELRKIFQKQFGLDECDIVFKQSIKSECILEKVQNFAKITFVLHLNLQSVDEKHSIFISGSKSIMLSLSDAAFDWAEEPETKSWSAQAWLIALQALYGENYICPSLKIANTHYSSMFTTNIQDAKNDIWEKIKKAKA